MAIPNELIDEILCLLPVKHLLRCRCVSKWWCSLIDSTAFVKKHLKKSMECNGDHGVIINGCGKFYLTDVESLDDENAAVVEIDEPLKTFVSGAQFVGSVNGLVCLSKNDINETLLINPSTRKYMMVPSVPAEFPRSFSMIETSLCGFGYDEVNDDYKVVKIAECYVQFHGIKVIVYSLRNNLWTWVNDEDVPDDTRFTGKCGMFVGGALHWLAIKNPVNCTDIIVRFDLGLEQFKELPYPPVDDSEGAFVNFNFTNVIHVGESLCIRDDYPESHLDIWLMKNNCEMENPWYKAFSVEQSGPLGSFRSLRPITFSKSSKDVLLEVDGARLVWYDLDKKAVSDVRIHGLPVNFDSHLYTESLLQLPSNKQLQTDKHEKKQQKKRDEFLSKGFKLRL